MFKTGFNYKHSNTWLQIIKFIIHVPGKESILELGIYNRNHRETKCKQGIPGRTHKAYFPIAETSSPTNIVLLMLYLGNLSL
jgi:hypothetical protein